MNKGKNGIWMILLGNILYLSYIFFDNQEITSFGEFTSGLLLGLSIGINIIGIILFALYISENEKKRRK